jgi:hypothetical protein
MMDNFDWAAFRAERNAALLSLDYNTITVYMRKYGEAPQPDGEVFWGGVHKARTAIKELPRAERLKSKRWLEAHGLHSMDDGDLTEGEPPHA